MYTVETALDSLQKYDIEERDLAGWEATLGLQIPVDEYGRKSYSPHHINLFKNVKKHLALGRTLDEIKNIISLPPISSSRPEAAPAVPNQTYASTPQKPTVSSPANVAINSVQQAAKNGNGLSKGNADKVVELVNRLAAEKDHLYKKLIETEKLNSHLYSANNMYHSKLKELNENVNSLKGQLRQDETFKLMDDKSRLHKQLLAAEKVIHDREKEIISLQQGISTLREQINFLEERIQSLTKGFAAELFCGDWMETGHLLEVVYDNFGINIESERMRLFRISQKPERIFGNTAVITTTYQYENNNLWKRNETLTVCWIDDNTLEGEVSAEYILDGVPVAKTIYRVTCARNAQ